MVITNNTKVFPDISAFKEIDDVIALTDRVKRLKKRFEDEPIHICSGRARLATESWRETEGENNLDIRKAKLFCRIMEGNPIAIKDDELIVGSQSQYVKGASIGIESGGGGMIIHYLSSKTLATSDTGFRVEITEEDRQNLLEDCKWWEGRSPADKARNESKILADRIPELKEWGEKFAPGELYHGYLTPAVKSVDYAKVVKVGFEGFIAEAREALSKLTYDDPVEDYEKDCFLQAVIIALEGAIEYAHRYARLAREMADKEKDPVRKKELERIAETCQQVPAKPARSFYEAVQSLWLTHICVNLEVAAIGASPNRIDQYLYPLYKKDVIEEGNMTRQEAAELLGCLFVKYNEITSIGGHLFSSDARANDIANTQLQNTVICGVTPEDGGDASNELSYMILEVLGQVPMPQPPIYVRYHPRINQEVWMKAIEINIKRGDGNPAFMNDTPEIKTLIDHGVSLSDARDWGVGGCAGCLIPGRCMFGIRGKAARRINTAKFFEYVLNNGCDPESGEQIGPATGDPRTFTSIEQFIDAFKQQIDYLLTIGRASKALYAIDVAYSRTPFTSALINDCISKGMDGRKGGVRYPQFLTHISDRCLQNVADSLAAIRKVVLEDKKISMEEMLEAVSTNFEGAKGESIRRMLLAAPKYGNDDDYVDEIFGELSEWMQERIGQEKNPLGTRMWQGRSGATAHWALGQVTGALPDGRKAGQPLADGFLSPSQGVDSKGPTAVFNSATKANHSQNSFAALFNMKFDGNAFDNRKKMVKYANLIETFFDRGGFHIQVNILDREILLDAQKHPDQYRNLLVRVAGFSAYFVDLPRELQDDIISRTEQPT